MTFKNCLVLVLSLISIQNVFSSEDLYCFLQTSKLKVDVRLKNETSLLASNKEDEFLAHASAIDVHCPGDYCLFQIYNENGDRTRIVTDAAGHFLYGSYENTEGMISTCKKKPNNGGGN